MNTVRLMKSEIDAVKFWSTTENMPNGCIEWVGSKGRKGYGQFHLPKMVSPKRRVVKSHRAAWVLANGEIGSGLHVLHTCDNPPCVNPEHLWLGTNSDNQNDSIRKHRQHQKNKTHCLRGHPLVAGNLIRSRWLLGHRACRTCRSENMRECRRRYRGDVIASPSEVVVGCESAPAGTVQQ